MYERSKTVNLAGVEIKIGELLNASPRYWMFVGALGVMLVLFLAAWITLLTKGGEVLAARDVYPWGLWFVNYMFYVGLSAGGLVVYSSVHLFGAKKFEPLSRLAVLQGLVFVTMALLCIVTDMEKPWRAINFMLSPNLTAPFIYTGSALNVYMGVCALDLWILMARKGGKRLALIMTLIALPTAVYMHSTTAWVLALNKSRELWNAAMMVPIFLSSATASGIALLFLFAYAFQKVTKVKFKKSMFRSLATLLATVIIVDLFFLSVEIVTVFWPTAAKPGHTIRLAEFFVGKYAVVFLPFLAIGLTAFILLARRKNRDSSKIHIIVCSMYVFGVFLKRFVLMAMGFSISPIGQIRGFYLPSLVEILIALGIVSMGLLAITLAVKLLPLEELEEEEYEETDEVAAAGLANTAVGVQPVEET